MPNSGAVVRLANSIMPRGKQNRFINTKCPHLVPARRINLWNLPTWERWKSQPLFILAGHLIGCDKKSEIVWYFQGKLCNKKGLLCGKLCKLCNFSLNYFKLVLPGFWERRPLLCYSNGDFFIKEQKITNNNEWIRIKI